MIKNYFIVGQKVLIYNSKDEILLLQRSGKSDNGGLWSLAGGGLKKGEKAIDGINREITEETHIKVSLPQPFYVKTYLDGDDFIVIIAYEARYIDGEVVLNWEHDSFTWVPKEKALSFKLTQDARSIIGKWTT